MTPSDAADVLLSLPRFAGVDDDAYAPGLDRIKALLDAMGRPHEQLRTVHVAGTNGKGSVASMIASIATASGMRTGLHTSPHLRHLTERMRVDGDPASAGWLADAVARHQADMERIGVSFFEATVALSFCYFADRAVDLAVVEVGLGGRLDATNVLTPDLAIITTVDLEHTALLGNTIAEIAREKAGIIKPNGRVLLGIMASEAETAIRAEAANQDALCVPLMDAVRWRAPHTDLEGSILDVETPLRMYDRLRLPLAGVHQQTNAVLAVRAAEAVVPGVTFEADPVHDGLAHLRRYSGLEGRLDVWARDPLVLVDVAHNPSSLDATLDTVAHTVSGDLIVGLTLARDKDLDAIAVLLDTYAATVVPLTVAARRARPPEEITDVLRSHGLAVRPAASVPEAITTFRTTAARDDALLLTGSHTLLAALPNDETAPSDDA